MNFKDLIKKQSMTPKILSWQLAKSRKALLVAVTFPFPNRAEVWGSYCLWRHEECICFQL